MENIEQKIELKEIILKNDNGDAVTLTVNEKGNLNIDGSIDSYIPIASDDNSTFNQIKNSETELTIELIKQISEIKSHRIKSLINNMVENIIDEKLAKQFETKLNDCSILELYNISENITPLLY